MRAGAMGMLVAVLASASLEAQEHAGWTLARLLEHARAHEPTLRAARLEVQIIEAELQQAELRANPRVEIEHRQVPGGMDRQTMATAAIPLELFRRGPRAAAARANVAVASAMAEERERNLLLDVHMAYSRYLVATRRLSVLDELIDQGRRTLSLLESRAAAGAIPRLERDQASVDVSRLEATRAVTAGAVESALVELRRSIGLEAGTPMTIADTLESAIAWTEIDAALLGPGAAMPVGDRSDLRVALAQVGVETARREQAKSEGRFDVAVFGGYMRMRSGFPQLGLDPTGVPVPIEATFNNVVVGAMIDVPLFNRNQGTIAAAELRAVAARHTADARRLAAAAELDVARARLRGAAASVRAFTKELRQTARRNVDVLLESYALGRNTRLEVAAEQQRYLEVEMAYGEALMEVLDAYAAWQAAMGRHQ